MPLGSVATRRTPLHSDRVRRDRGLFQTEEGAKHPGLSVQVRPGDAQHLTFPNHLYCLDPCNDHRRSRGGPRTLHCTQAPLNVAVIGFDAIV
jgi:hypothetical protein